MTQQKSFYNRRKQFVPFPLRPSSADFARKFPCSDLGGHPAVRMDGVPSKLVSWGSSPALPASRRRTGADASPAKLASWGYSPKGRACRGARLRKNGPLFFASLASFAAFQPFFNVRRRRLSMVFNVPILTVEQRTSQRSIPTGANLCERCGLRVRFFALFQNFLFPTFHLTALLRAFWSDLAGGEV